MEKIKEVHFVKSFEKNIEFEIIPLDVFYKKYKTYITTSERIDFWAIIIITDGECDHWLDFEKYHLSAGSFLFIRQRQVQKFELNEKMKGYMFLFTTSFLYKNESDKELLSNFHIFNNFLNSPLLQPDNITLSELEKITSHLCRIFDGVNDFAKDEMLRSIFKVFLYTCERFKRDKTNNVYLDKDVLLFNKFRSLVENNISHKTTVQNYAEMLFISNKKLNYLTQKYLAKSAKLFIAEQLILESKRLLVHTSISIKETAYQLGFEEPTNFVKFFKRFTKLTPQNFRELQKI